MTVLDELAVRAYCLDARIALAKLRFRKINPCHVPSGPKGGQFCETGGGGGGKEGVTWGNIIDRSGTSYEVRHTAVQRNIDNRKPELGTVLRHDFKVYAAGSKGTPKENYSGIGEATLTRSGDKVMDVQIDSRFQRKGIATALYSHIENVMGNKLKPNTQQTDEGMALWVSRTRNK